MSGSSQYSRGISAKSRSSPGARIIQLGEFKGLRIDRAPESHCRGLVRKSYEEKAPSSLVSIQMYHYMSKKQKHQLTNPTTCSYSSSATTMRSTSTG